MRCSHVCDRTGFFVRLLPFRRLGTCTALNWAPRWIVNFSSWEVKGSAHTALAAKWTSPLLGSSEDWVKRQRHISTSVELLLSPAFIAQIQRSWNARARLRPTLWVRASVSDKPAGCNDSPPTLSPTKILTFRPPLRLTVVYRRTNSSTAEHLSMSRVCECF